MFGSQGSSGASSSVQQRGLPSNPEKRWLFDVVANKTNGSE